MSAERDSRPFQDGQEVPEGVEEGDPEKHLARGPLCIIAPDTREEIMPGLERAMALPAGGDERFSEEKNDFGRVWGSFSLGRKREKSPQAQNRGKIHEFFPINLLTSENPRPIGCGRSVV